MNRTSVFVAVIVGILIRLLLLTYSLGANDATYWERIAQSLHDVGWADTYENLVIFSNHPPLMGVIWSGCLLISNGLGVRFLTVFKLLTVACDVVTFLLIFRLVEELKPGNKTYVKILYALNPVAILMSAYHGNSDSIYTVGMVGAARAAHSGRFFWSALAFALAINVKLIPILMLPALLLTAERRGQLPIFLFTVSLSTLPYLLVLLLIGTGPLHTIFGYQPPMDRWGIQELLLRLSGTPALLPTALVPPSILLYRVVGPGIIMIVSTLITIPLLKETATNIFDCLAVVLAMFLFLLSGFGFQYFTSWIPFLVLSSASWGLVMSLCIGCLCAHAYIEALTPSALLFSHNPVITENNVLLGLLTWALIGTFAVVTLFYPRTARAI